MQIKMNMISFFIAIIVCLLPAASTAQSEKEIKASIKGSDNYKKFERQFLKVSEKAIRSGKCTLADFKSSGGWAKATGKNSGKPVYFIYCGGFTLANRYYANINTGSFYQE
jgi:hypothetical protein